MTKYYITNKNRKALINEFVLQMYDDYKRKALNREVILNFTILDFSFRGISSSSSLKEILKERDLDVIDFKAVNKQKEISIHTRSILKIEYDITIEHKITFLTDDETIVVEL